MNPLLWFLGLWLRSSSADGGRAAALLGGSTRCCRSRRPPYREIGVRVALGGECASSDHVDIQAPADSGDRGRGRREPRSYAVATIVAQQTTGVRRDAGEGLTPGNCAARGYAILMLWLCMIACVVPTIGACGCSRGGTAGGIAPRIGPDSKQPGTIVPRYAAADFRHG